MSALLDSLLDAERLADVIANDAEDRRIAADRAEPSASQKVQREADRAQQAELQRDPRGGFAS